MFCLHKKNKRRKKKQEKIEIKFLKKIFARRKQNFAYCSYRSLVEKSVFQENAEFQSDISRFYICLDDIKKLKKNLNLTSENIQ